MVIAIIAILAALLLPVARSMIAKSQTVQCTNNMRQIYVVLQRYAGDNEGRLPNFYFDPASFPDKGGQCWFSVPPYWTDIPDGRARANIRCCPANPFLYSDRSNYLYNSEIGYSGGDEFNRPIVYTNLSKALLLMDSGGTTADTTGYGIAPTFPIERLNPAWHNGGGNFMFLDGHIEWLKAGTTNRRELFRPEAW